MRQLRLTREVLHHDLHGADAQVELQHVSESRHNKVIYLLEYLIDEVLCKVTKLQVAVRGANAFPGLERVHDDLQQSRLARPVFPDDADP